MDPLTLALLGGTAMSGVSGLLGMNSQNQAMAYNAAANQANINAAERARFQAMIQAWRQDHDTKLGTTDASGNRTHFVPGVGWVTDLQGQSQQINQGQLNEQQAVLEQDLPRQRRQQMAAEAQQGNERSTADTLGRAFMDRMRQGDTPSDYEALFRDAATRGVNESADASTTAAMRSAIRGGASNTGEILASLDRGRNKSMSDAFMDAKVKAMEYAGSKRNADLGNTSSLYNMWATRGTGVQPANYQPSELSGKGASTAFAQLSSANGKNSIDAASLPPGTVDYIQPNMGAANLVGQLGQAAMGIGSQMGARQDLQQMRDMWMRYLGTSPYGNRLQYGGMY